MLERLEQLAERRGVLLGEQLGRAPSAPPGSRSPPRAAWRTARRPSCRSRRRPSAGGACGRARSCRPVISRSARCWSPVSSQGRLCLQPGGEVPLHLEGHAAHAAAWPRRGRGSASAGGRAARRRRAGGGPAPPLRRRRDGAPRGAPRPARAARRRGGASRGAGRRSSAISASRCRSISDRMTLVTQPLGGGIDREDLSGRQRIGLAVALRRG